jgi:hypothetical protein
MRVRIGSLASCRGAAGAIGLLLATSIPSFAAQHDGGAGLVAGDAIELDATVKAVDKETRSVTLEAETGRTVTVKAGPEVKNFDQIEVGDKVEVDYVEALALHVEKAGGSPMAEVGAAIEKALPGQKPAVAVAGTVEIKAKMTAIDKEKRTVTLQGPEGNARTIKVDPKVKRFDELAVGDDVVARYTEAIAIAVKKP